MYSIWFFITIYNSFCLSCKTNPKFQFNGKNENDKMYPYDLSNLNICTHYYRNTIV